MMQSLFNSMSSPLHRASTRRTVGGVGPVVGPAMVGDSGSGDHTVPLALLRVLGAQGGVPPEQLHTLLALANGIMGGGVPHPLHRYPRCL